jgi:hypothetical protein
MRDSKQEIPGLDLKGIFTLFCRGSIVNDGSDGMGIGLIVVKRTLGLHYGHIEVHSAEDKRKTFTLSMPIEKIDLEKSAKAGFRCFQPSGLRRKITQCAAFLAAAHNTYVVLALIQQVEVYECSGSNRQTNYHISSGARARLPAAIQKE